MLGLSNVSFKETLDRARALPPAAAIFRSSSTRSIALASGWLADWNTFWGPSPQSQTIMISEHIKFTNGPGNKYITKIWWQVLLSRKHHTCFVWNPRQRTWQPLSEMQNSDFKRMLLDLNTKNTRGVPSIYLLYLLTKHIHGDLPCRPSPWEKVAFIHMIQPLSAKPLRFSPNIGLGTRNRHPCL